MSTEADPAVTDGSEATQVDRVNTGALGTLVAVGLFAMISIATAVTALVRHDVEEEEATKDADQNQVVIALKNEQRGILNGPAGYADRVKGRVTVPIELAKQLVLNDLARDPSSATPPSTTDNAVTSTVAASAVGAPTSPSSEPAKKTAEAGTSGAEKKGPGARLEMVKDHKLTAPTKSPPASAPSATAAERSAPLTPTAASPAAKAPGPLKN
jgi:hypothetical protein